MAMSRTNSYTDFQSKLAVLLTIYNVYDDTTTHRWIKVTRQLPYAILEKQIKDSVRNVSKFILTGEHFANIVW